MGAKPPPPGAHQSHGRAPEAIGPAESGTVDVVALDVRPLDPELARRCAVSLTGDIRDRRLLERLRSEFEIHAIYHLAAILSTRAEFVPETAHDVNVGGTLNLLQLAVEEARVDHDVGVPLPKSGF